MATVKRKSPGSKSRGARNIAWIEEHVRIPEGKMVGQAVRLTAKQKRWIKRIYDSPTRTFILSMARKNAKTALASFLLLLHLCGPEARANSQLYSAAQSREQAAVLFNLAAKSVRMSPDLHAVIIIRDTAKELVCQEIGTKYRALSADASTAYGLSPVFTVHDELGQVKGKRSELFEALETASGAHDEPMSVIISTQAPTDGDLLSILIDDAKEGKDPRVKLSIYEADVSIDPFTEKAIKQANPAFGDFQNAKETLAMAEDARRMPSREPEFRNLILNQRVEMNSPFIPRSVWEQNGDAPSLKWDGLTVYAGLDLSAVNDLTAFVPICNVDGCWEIDPRFWLPREGLKEKARNDRQIYDVWADRGFLRTTPGKAVEYEFVAREIYEFYRTHRDLKVAFDRWGMKFFQPWLLKAGFTEEQIEQVFVEFGQGFVSMSPALRDTEAVLLEGKAKHGNHPVLSMCAANAVVTMDPAGNRKLNKAKSATRIDGMVALAMAFGVAPNEIEPTPAYEMLIV